MTVGSLLKQKKSVTCSKKLLFLNPYVSFAEITSTTLFSAPLPFKHQLDVGIDLCSNANKVFGIRTDLRRAGENICYVCEQSQKVN